MNITRNPICDGQYHARTPRNGTIWYYNSVFGFKILELPHFELPGRFYSGSRRPTNFYPVHRVWVQKVGPVQAWVEEYKGTKPFHFTAKKLILDNPLEADDQVSRREYGTAKCSTGQAILGGQHITSAGRDTQRAPGAKASQT